MTTERFVEKVAEEIIEGLHDRKGLSDILDSLKYDDPEIYSEILQEVGQAAIAVTGMLEMKEALEPFAKLADEIESIMGPNGNPDRWAKSCQWSDLLRARKALQDG